MGGEGWWGHVGARRKGQQCPRLQNRSRPHRRASAYDVPPAIRLGKRIQLGTENLISGFFAVLDEGNGFRSKAVGHFVCSQGDPENILMVSVVIPQPADEHASVLHRELPLLGHDALDGFEDIGSHGDVSADVNVAPLLLQGSVHGFCQLLLQDVLHVLLWSVWLPGVGRVQLSEDPFVLGL